MPRTIQPDLVRCDLCARQARGAAAAGHAWADLWPLLCAACRTWLAALEEPLRAAVIAERARQQAGRYESAEAVDPQRGQELAARVAGARGDCWRCAWEGWPYIRHGVYVEGFMAPHGRHPIAHGWVEDADGVVLDVAMPGEGAIYIAGARYVGQYALHVANMRYTWPMRFAASRSISTFPPAFPAAPACSRPSVPAGARLAMLSKPASACIQGKIHNAANINEQNLIRGALART